jgi:hypothetical protein
MVILKVSELAPLSRELARVDQSEESTIQRRLSISFVVTLQP